MYYAERLNYDGDHCSIKRALEVVGEKWTLLVLREAFFGARRFGEFHDAIGCAKNILSDRLATLVENGLLRREPYQEPGRRTRDEYRLTDKGLELFPALVALMQWGDRWCSDAGGPPVLIRHRDCGEPVSATLSCAAGHQALSARDTEPVAGPGARLAA